MSHILQVLKEYLWVDSSYWWFPLRQLSGLIQLVHLSFMPTYLFTNLWKGPERLQKGRTDTWTRYKAQLSNILCPYTLERPREAGPKAQQWDSVHSLDSYKLYGWTSHSSQHQPTHLFQSFFCGSWPFLAFFLLHLQSHMSYAPSDLPPTHKAHTDAFYFYLWTEKRLVSILP